MCKRVSDARDDEGTQRVRLPESIVFVQILWPDKPTTLLLFEADGGGDDDDEDRTSLKRYRELPVFSIKKGKGREFFSTFYSSSFCVGCSCKALNFMVKSYQSYREQWQY